ncbi:MAG: ferritin family protein [Candidatus Cloacimonetes bacterium]|nr:ferritin family protein [Candidatus Cloacimonadota bacterium]
MERREALKLAIQAEISSQNLYKALAKSFMNPETSTLFKNLVPMEKMHEEKLRAIFKKEFPGEEPDVDPDKIQDIRQVKIREAKAVLEYAISREEIAHASYLLLAEHSQEESLKKLLIHFAEEELNHKTFLLNEIQRLQGVVQWYDPSELNGFMED